MLLILAGRKPSHTSSATVVLSVLRSCAALGGVLHMHPSRQERLNAVYVLFSPSNRYIYIGETSSGAREYQHLHAMLHPVGGQRVHLTTSSLGHSHFGLLTMNLPSCTDRMALECALVRQFDGYGKWLLNDRLRLQGSIASKSRTLNASTTRYLSPSPAPVLPSHHCSFYRPFRRVTRMPKPALSPCRIPTVILFAGGFGGALLGLWNTGCYDVKLVVDYDQHAVCSLRRLFPTLNVVRFKLGGDFGSFTRLLAGVVPRHLWPLLCVQASPPCTMLSRNRDMSVQSSIDAMHLTLWTIQVCEALRFRFWWIEQVPAAAHLLDRTDLFIEVHDLSLWIPQRRRRCVIANFDFMRCLQRRSRDPIPRGDVLPHLPDGSRVENRYRFSVPLSEPSITVVGKPIYVRLPHGERRPVTPDEAKVLQGFPFTHSWTHVPVWRARQFYGDAVPPVFSYEMGWSLVRLLLGPASMTIRWVSAVGDTHFLADADSTLVLPTVYTVSPGGYVGHDLAQALRHSTSSVASVSVITVRHGNADTTNAGDLRDFHGYAYAIVGCAMRPISLHYGLRGLRHGFIHTLLVYSLRCASLLSPEVCTLLRGIYASRFSRKRIPRKIRLLSFWDFHHLYTNLDSSDFRPEFTARVRSRLTSWCQRIFNVHPRPAFGIRCQAHFGLRRSTLRRLCFALVQPLQVPPAVRSFVLNDMAISFTATPTVGATVCNFRRFCSVWSPDSPWPCTCEFMRSEFHLPVSSESQAPDHQGCSHYHVRFDQCRGRHADVLLSNLRDAYPPDDGSLIESVLGGLRGFLLNVRDFACAIRRIPVSRLADIVTCPRDGYAIPTALLPVANLCASFGFHFSKRCSDILRDAMKRDVAYRDGSVVSERAVRALAATVNDSQHPVVCSHLDKNPGLGCLVCPRLYWSTLYSTFWDNDDYLRTDHTAQSLIDLHHRVYVDGGWATIGPFHAHRPGYHIPFAFGKFKSNRKVRPVLGAARFCLRVVYARASLALRVCLLAITRDDAAWDANLFTTFDAPRLIRTKVNGAIDELTQSTHVPITQVGVDAYAGDVSSMFDKLPCAVVMKAVHWALDKATHVTQHYNLRRSTRRSVTINLLDPLGHRIGKSYDGEHVVTIPHAMLVEVAEHYCFNTFFLIAGKLLQLQLGVPQGGSLSDPLSKIFCTYCENMWLSSLFDNTRFQSSGAVRPCDMTERGLELFSAATGESLDPLDDNPLAYAVLARYADDCRPVAVFDAASPVCEAAAGAFIDSYRKDCYADPCELSDESRGVSFHFMQGFYTFLPKCTSTYVARNAVSLLSTGRRKLRSMQSFYSYGQAPSTLRFATLMGKLAEIEAVCSDPARVASATLLLIVELVHLDYPFRIVCDALYRKYNKTSDPIWKALIPLARRMHSYCRVWLPRILALSD